MAHLSSDTSGLLPHNLEAARIQSLIPLYLRETAATSSEANAAGKETSLISLLEEYYKFLNMPGMVQSLEIIRSDVGFAADGTNVGTGHDGSGHGLTINYQVGLDSPKVSDINAVTINNPGHGYKINDYVTIKVGDLTAEFRVTDVVSGPSDVINRVLSEHDLNTVSEDFVSEFQKEIAVSVPYNSLTEISKKALFKKILKYYNMRGSESSIKSFFKIFFDTDVALFYPKNYIFKPSDSGFKAGDYVPERVDIDPDTGATTSGATRVDLDSTGSMLLDSIGGTGTTLTISGFTVPPTRTRIRMPGLNGTWSQLYGGNDYSYSGVMRFDHMGPGQGALIPCNVFFDIAEGKEGTTSTPGWCYPQSAEDGGISVLCKDPDSERWMFLAVSGGIRTASSHGYPSGATDPDVVSNRALMSSAGYTDDNILPVHTIPDVRVAFKFRNHPGDFSGPFDSYNFTYASYPDSVFPPTNAGAWSVWNTSYTDFGDGSSVPITYQMSDNLYIESIDNPGLTYTLNGTYGFRTTPEGNESYVLGSNTRIKLAQIAGRWSLIDVSAPPPATIEFPAGVKVAILNSDSAYHGFESESEYDFLSGTWTKQSGGARDSFSRQDSTTSSDKRSPGVTLSPALTSLSTAAHIKNRTPRRRLSEYYTQGGLTFPSHANTPERISRNGMIGPNAAWLEMAYPYYQWEIDNQASEWTHTASGSKGLITFLSSSHAQYDNSLDGIDNPDYANEITISQKFSMFRMNQRSVGGVGFDNGFPDHMWVIYDHWRDSVIAHTLPNNPNNYKLYPPKTGWIGTGYLKGVNNVPYGISTALDENYSAGFNIDTGNIEDISLIYNDNDVPTAEGRVLYQDKVASSLYDSIISYVQNNISLTLEAVQDSSISGVKAGSAIDKVDTPSFSKQLSVARPTPIPVKPFTLENKYYIQDYSPGYNVELFDDSPMQPDKMIYVVDGFTGNKSVLNGEYEFFDQTGDGSPGEPQVVTYHNKKLNKQELGGLLIPFGDSPGSSIGGNDSPQYQLKLVMDSNDGGGAIIGTTRDLFGSPGHPDYFANISTVGDGTDVKPGQKPIFAGTVSAQPRYIGVPARIGFYDEDVQLIESDKIGFETKIVLNSNTGTKQVTTGQKDFFLKPNKIYFSNKPNAISIVERDSSPVSVGPTQHLIQPWTAAGKSFTSISLDNGHQHLFTYAIERSVVKFFDNSPVTAQNPTEEVTLKPGDSHTFISRINSNKHAPDGVGSENFPGIAYLKSTGNILASTATFEKQNSPKEPAAAPKAMAILTPTSTDSYIKNPFNSPDASPSNVVVVDQQLNTNFNSPGKLNRSDFTLTDAIFNEQSPAEAENSFLGSFILAGNAPHGNDGNTSPTDQVSIFSIGDGFGSDMTAGISRRNMIDNYFYGKELTDYCIITPYDNTINVKYKLPTFRSYSDKPATLDKYLLEGFDVRDFSPNTTNASPGTIDTFINTTFSQTNSHQWDESPNGKIQILRRKPGTPRVATPDIGTNRGQWSIMLKDAPNTVFFTDIDVISQTDSLEDITWKPADDRRLKFNGSSTVGKVFGYDSTLNEKVKVRFDEYTYKTHTLQASLNSPNGVQVYGPVSEIDASPDAGARKPIVVPDSPKSTTRVVPRLWKFTSRRPFALIINNNGNEEFILGGKNENTYNSFIYDASLAGFASQRPRTASFSVAGVRSVGLQPLADQTDGINQTDDIGNLIITENNLADVQVETGFNSSLLSHQLKIQDLQYYSDFSYEIRSKLPISTWGSAFEKFAHPAGLKFYGKLMDSPNDSPF